MTEGETLPALSKITKLGQPKCPILNYDARFKTSSKRITEYQQAYREWPWQPVRQSYKPEPPKKTSDKQKPMQKKTSYALDYAAHPVQPTMRAKKPKGSLSISKKSIDKITTYNMEFYSKQLPEFSKDSETLWPARKIPPDTEPLTFEGETIYSMSYPAYEPKTIYDAKPALISTKDNLTVPAAGDIAVKPKTTVQRDYVPYENAKPPEPIRPKGNEITPSEPIEKEPAKPKDTAVTKTELVGKELKAKEQDIDPLKHIHLAKLKQLVEISPQFDAISTAMADFTAPNKPQRRNLKFHEDNIRCTSAPFYSDTTFKMTYKEWPVMPPEHPVWAKKPAYKRRSGGFVTKSLYSKDFCDPHVVDRDRELRPVTRDVNIITNKPGNRPFNYITTYDSDYKYTEGAKVPESYVVIQTYNPPMTKMAAETVQMADYKGQQTDMPSPIRHISQHRDLYDTASMTFDTTYNENFRGYRPKSCPSKLASPPQNSAEMSNYKTSPIPKPDLSVLPRINAYPIPTPPVTPAPQYTPTPRKNGLITPRNSPEM